MQPDSEGQLLSDDELQLWLERDVQVRLDDDEQALSDEDEQLLSGEDLQILLDGDLPIWLGGIVLGQAQDEHGPIERNPEVQRPHSISREKFIEVLAALRSPAASEAEALADIPGRYGIDRGIALAFFVHESSAGKAGIVRDYGTRNWGNLRRPQRPERGEIIATRAGNFARYKSWAAGLEDWCELMVYVYRDRWRLTTLGDVLKKYAPRADQNDPEQYARKVVQHIKLWQGEMKKAVSARAPRREGEAQWHVTVTASVGLNIRRGPGTGHAVVGKLAHGQRVLVRGEGEGWLELADGRGYIAGGYTARS